MLRPVRYRYAGPLLLVLCGTGIIVQVLVRPAVGIANNGDFPKMGGPLRLGPERGDWSSYKPSGEFVYHYVRADRYAYDRDFGTADFLSSEFFLVKLAARLQKIAQPGPRFDIRWLGGVNGAFFLLAIGIWLYALPAPWRLYIGPLLILIWTDVAYVQYMNSFYMDTAAMIFLVLGVAAALHAVKDGDNRMFPLLMASAVILFATSKSQHAIPALLFIPLLLGFAFWSRDWVVRTTWAAGSVLLVLGACVVLGRDTDQRRSTPMFTLVFWRLAPEASDDPLHTLEELGLGKNELHFLHTNAYSPNSPIYDMNWIREFHSRCNYLTLLRYYLRHPSVPVRFLYQDLSGPASRLRPFGNLSPDDGYQPYSQATHFTFWTDLRSFLFKRAPWHIILLELGIAVGALWLLFRHPVDRPFAGLVLVIQTLAAMEYGIAVLADAAETDRHLMIFHVSTEISILLLPLVVSKIYPQFRTSRIAIKGESILLLSRRISDR